jgi:hypothetical protein
MLDDTGMNFADEFDFEADHAAFKEMRRVDWQKFRIRADCSRGSV